MNKQKILIYTITALGLAGLLGLGFKQYIYAQEGDSKYPPLIQKLIDKFDLNTTEVDKVIAEERSERQAERQKDIGDKLTQAVNDGKITEDQKVKIFTKWQELEKNRQVNMPKGNFSQLTDDEKKVKMEERRTEMEKQRTEWQAFEKELGIDLDSIIGPMGFGGFKGFGHGEGFMRNTQENNN